MIIIEIIIPIITIVPVVIFKALALRLSNQKCWNTMILMHLIPKLTILI